MSDSEDVTIRSSFGDLRVVVLYPGVNTQQGVQFRPTATGGLGDFPRRDLSIIRAMLQDAMQDIDEEFRKRQQADYERMVVGPIPVPQAYPR